MSPGPGPDPNTSRSTRGRGRTRWRAAIAPLAMLVVVLITGCSSTGADEPTRAAGQEGYVGAQKSVTIIPPAERKPAPVISGDVLGQDGKTISTADFDGQVIVLNVWGSWCPPCRAEAPDLQKASERTDDTAQFIGLNTRDYQQAAPAAFADKIGITYPSIWDPTGSVLVSLADTLPPSAIPSTLIIDGEGRMAARIVGTVTETTLVDLITDVADGK